MAKYTPEEERQLALKKQFNKRRSEQKEEALSCMTEEQKAFLNERTYGEVTLHSKLGKELVAFLEQGGKPSVFVGEKLSFLFDTGYIPADYKPAMLWAADRRIDYLYSGRWTRRSFRTADYSKHVLSVYSLLYSFRNELEAGVSAADALTLHLPEDTLAHVTFDGISEFGYCDETIAYALDHGDTAVQEAIKDIFAGESKLSPSWTIIQGVLMSHNAEMHGELCKLLKAARLQEGLRQVICERADDGTTEGFLAVLKAIEEDDLIRFSSVKRAAGVWTGLMTADTKDLDRISGKTITLMREMLTSKEARQAALQTEDSMQIYMALWAYGFHEIRDALREVERIAADGTHHQLLTAGYFANHLDQADFEHQIAKKVILEHGSEQDIAAIYLPLLMSDWKFAMGSNYYSRKVQAPDWSFRQYFESREEAEKLYGILENLLDTMPKKEPVFSPCVFPWYSATLSRSDILLRMGMIAGIYADDEKTDRVAELLPQIDVDDRCRMMQLLLWEPRTEKQRAALTTALCDKGSWNREAAYEMIVRTGCTAGQYRQMEEMLKYKAADARANLIKLLLKQDDTALTGSIERLLADKKEEKRTAGLDLILQVCADENRAGIAEQCRALAAGLQAPSGKEQILLEQIAGDAGQDGNPEDALFSADDVYQPVAAPQEFAEKCAAIFRRYYPDTEIFGAAPCKEDIAPSIQQARDDLSALDALVDANREREFQHGGEVFTMDCNNWAFYEEDENGNRVIPFRELWKNWCTENGITPERIERMCVVIDSGIPQAEYGDKLFGKGAGEKWEFPFTHNPIVRYVLNDLYKQFSVQEHAEAIAYTTIRWFLDEMPEEARFVGEKRPYNDSIQYTHFFEYDQLYYRVSELLNPLPQNRKYFFDLRCMLKQQVKADERYKDHSWRYGKSVENLFPEIEDYVRAAFAGEMTEQALLHTLFTGEYLAAALGMLSRVNTFVRDDGVQRSTRNGRYYWRARSVRTTVNELVGAPNNTQDELSEEARALLRYAADLFDKIIAVVLPVELHRGDSLTKYSKVIRRTERIYGMENLIAILSALGQDTLDRGASVYSSNDSKRMNLSYLLSVCVPNEGDDVQKLTEMLRQTDITEQRLIETALYAPEWLPLIAEYLNWPGFTSACYYFMAHMNESFDDTRKAVIAKYTPLTEEELQLGAFDIDWFRSALQELGEKRFAQIYDAAKYISDGAKHGRARKYADAVQGKLDAGKTEAQIADKRNKDLLMAYALIPVADEKALMHRYLRIVQYRKEAAKFGAQRSASERKAADTALRNLALNAGFADVTRLTLRMETKIAEDSKVYFDGITIDDMTAKLVISETGEVSLSVEKKGKALKSVPAKYKKNADIVAMQEAKKQLTEQHRRTRVMFEQAMEEETPWKAEEIAVLMQNPVAAPILKLLVFGCAGKFGFFGDMALTDAQGNRTALDPADALLCAHPAALRQAGVWEDYQRYLFENKLVQPFKQVFRELYVKTDEEKNAARSLRYAGNQIQPQKTVAVLKSRRWIADAESGLQKVFYENNLIAVIYALADWFSPADIEAPTLEYVAFYDRKTGKEKKIAEIPDVLFSEVMRDVDLAVSVAHAGGVDPETSHSTVEMRAALVTMTAGLLKLGNVRISGSHAHIAGSRADYTVHLGSGVVHKRGGTMLNILPVHSQHRGRIFLPFADDDPKTAEILSKIILLSEDDKIKDPTILSQL